MDQDIKAFRLAAARENGSRKGLQRRYSVRLRAQAVRCWEGRQRAGDVAGSRRGARRGAVESAPLDAGVPPRSRFHPVQVVRQEPRVPSTAVVVLAAAAGQLRVEGLDVESAARVLALLR
jgi:hypothetical protein